MPIGENFSYPAPFSQLSSKHLKSFTMLHLLAKGDYRMTKKL